MKTTSVNTTIQTWLKRLSATHNLKQAHMFTKEQVRHFIESAPDSHLDFKLILMVGVYRGLRCDTISQLEWRHIRLGEQQVELFVDYETKTDQGATGTWFAFPRRADNPALDPLLLFNKYRQKIAKKDTGLLSGRVWLRIIQGKKSTDKEVVTRQVRGREWVGTVPKRVAEWLGLPEAAKYTGHSLRRTCAQWAADSGMTEVQMQHHFGWRSSAMISKYTRSSTNLKSMTAACLDMEDRQGIAQGQQQQPLNPQNMPVIIKDDDTLPGQISTCKMDLKRGERENETSKYGLNDQRQGEESEEEGEQEEEEGPKRTENASIDEMSKKSQQRGKKTIMSARPLTEGLASGEGGRSEFVVPNNWTFNGSSVNINVYNGGPPVIHTGAGHQAHTTRVAMRDDAHRSSGVRPIKIRLLCKDDIHPDEKN